MNNKIFIQLASYRDPELIPTIESLLTNAKWPKNLVFSIAHQYSDDDSWNLDKFAGDPRFKIVPIKAEDSRGACHSRNLLQQQYDGEEWTLQLDSHHRFVYHWDEILINMWTSLHESGVAKPLITTYLPSYNPSEDPLGRTMQPWRMNFREFAPEGVLLYNSGYITDWEKLTGPIPTYFYSAHFAFTKGIFTLEVPHDPHLYFHGEECSIAARAWTWGYDLFHPHILVAWHEYTRKHRTKHWDDHKLWWQHDKMSKQRYRYLVGQEKSKDLIDWGPYGWGTVRDIKDYAAVTGIDLINKKYKPI